MTQKLSETIVWLGVLASVLSSVKALNSWFQFGFHGVWNDILTYYTEITEPFRELINNLFSNYEIPSWLPDILILYVVLVMAGYRATVYPLRYNHYLSVHNTKRIDTLLIPEPEPDPKGLDINERIAVWAKEYNFEPDCFMHGKTKGGICEASIKVERPTWQVYTYRTLRCLTLFPTISLEPYRKMSHSPKRLFQLLRSKENDGVMVKEGNTTYTVRWLEFDLAQLHRALQLVALPVLVFVFIFLGTYLS